MADMLGNNNAEVLGAVLAPKEFSTVGKADINTLL